MPLDSMDIMTFHLQGFYCSQILTLQALEEQGKKNPDLIRSMTALCLGLGCGKVCGALTGGCCVLGLYAGKATAEENADPRLPIMLTEFNDWFEQKFTSLYGGITCADITKDDERLRMDRCPDIVRASFEKVTEILRANGYQLSHTGRQEQSS